MDKKLELLAESIKASGLVRPELLKEEKFFDKPFTKEQILNILEAVGFDTKVYNFDYLIKETGIRGIINEAKGPTNFFLPMALAASIFGGSNAINKLNQIQPIISNAETQHVQALDSELQKAIEDRGAMFADLLARYKADLESNPGQYWGEWGQRRKDYVNDYFETLANAKPGDTTMIAAAKPYAINVPVSSNPNNPKFHNVNLQNIKPGGLYDIALPRSANFNRVTTRGDAAEWPSIDIDTITDEDHEALEKEAKEKGRKSVAGQVAPLQKDATTSGALAAGAGLWGLGSAVRKSKDEELGLEEAIEFSQFGKPQPEPKLFTTEQLVSLFESLKLDTKKYTVEYLAEQIGFVPLDEYYETAHDLAAKRTGYAMNQNLPKPTPTAKEFETANRKRKEIESKNKKTTPSIPERFLPEKLPREKK
jgi:hypothetical protein